MTRMRPPAMSPHTAPRTSTHAAPPSLPSPVLAIGEPGGPGAPYGPGGPGTPAPLEQPSGPSTRTSVLEREQVEEQLVEPGDHERFSHYVRKEKILESALSGDPVIALCGKVWVPGRDPQRFPVCPTCKELLNKHWPSDDE